MSDDLEIVCFDDMKDKDWFKSQFEDFSCQYPVSGGYVAQFFTWPHPSMFWLAIKEGQVDGRIAAFRASSKPERGFVGLFDASNTRGALMLLTAATDWLRNLGIREIYGPVDASTWHRYRLSSAATVTPAHETVLPPHAPDLAEAFQTLGFCERNDYQSFGFAKAAIPGACALLERSFLRACTSGYQFEALNPQLVGALFPEFYQLVSRCFRDAPLFEPIDYEAFCRQNRQISKLDIHPYSFALSRDGQLEGFLLAFRTGNEVIIKTIAVDAIAPSRGLRTWSPAQAMLYLCLRSAVETNASGVTAALLHHGASSQFLVSQHASVLLWRQNHVIYERFD